jgi:phospholipid/cholesterol/gamma-HCH transport system permease protein
LQLALGRLGIPLVGALARGWRLLHFSAIALATALSPSVYDRAQLQRTARRIWLTSWQVLPWFSGLSALISLVLSRVVVVTAASYGLSKYALEMLVRVLVIELIPLAAALFVALRSAADDRRAIPAPPAEDTLESWSRSAVEAVPHVTATAFAVWLLAAVSSFIALLLAYIVVYGFSPWGVGIYTRTVGQVFEPAVSYILVLKTVLFSWAVAVIPAAADRLSSPRRRARPGAPAGMVQLFVVLILIEAASLSLKYL